MRLEKDKKNNRLSRLNDGNPVYKNTWIRLIANIQFVWRDNTRFANTMDDLTDVFHASKTVHSKNQNNIELSLL